MAVTLENIKSALNNIVSFNPGLNGHPLKVIGKVTAILPYSLVRTLTDINALNALADTPVEKMEFGNYFCIETDQGTTKYYACEWISDLVTNAATSTFLIRLTAATMDELNLVLKAATDAGIAAEIVPR